MNLGKHASGGPLSAAELKQRRDAARARWATLGAGAATGAVAGGLWQAGKTAVLTQNQAAAAARMAGVVAADAIDRNRERLYAAAAARRSRIDEAVAHRMRVNPETKAERQTRLRMLLNRETPTGTPRDQRPPVIGSVENLRIYDYELAATQRELKRAQTHLHSLEAREQAGEDVPQRDLRARRVTVNRIQREIERLQQLKAAAPKPIARRSTQRGPAETPVTGTVVRQFRRGETQRQIGRRILDAKRQLRTRHAQLLDRLNRRTDALRVAQREAALAEAEATIREAFNRNAYGRIVMRGGARGALIGAGLGLSAAGLAVIAHHVARTVSGRSDLAKATPEDPEDSIAKGLSETYRAWIDRLLGRSETPMDLGDTLAAALAPGITQAFANGATTPPVPPAEGEGEPKYTVDVDFDLLNPAVRRHMADYTLDRIVDISTQQREAIRQVLMQQSVLQGIGPREVARSLRETIGLTPYQMRVVQGYRAELVALDPAALERRLRDKRYDRTVRRAIETNTPLSAEQIDAMVDAYHRRMLALRAETIARTESIRATSYGAVARAQDVLDQHPDLDVIKRWIATDDSRTRDTHRDLDGKEVRGMETPFRTSADNLIRWPVDQDSVADETINCRCSLGFRFIPKTATAVPDAVFTAAE